MANDHPPFSLTRRSPGSLVLLMHSQRERRARLDLVGSEQNRRYGFAAMLLFRWTAASLETSTQRMSLKEVPCPCPHHYPEGTTMLPKGTFDGKVVAITGGGSGLGKAFGLEFARLGATIAILSRKEEHRLKGVKAIGAIGGKAIQAPLDVRDASAVKAAFDAIEGSVGPVDIFLNNAAGNFPVPAEDLSPNGFRTVIQIDLEGTFNCSA